MMKMEGQYIVASACNNGSSALVNRDGELFLFGKDTAHADHNTGEYYVPWSPHVSDWR